MIFLLADLHTKITWNCICHVSFASLLNPNFTIYWFFVHFQVLADTLDINCLLVWNYRINVINKIEDSYCSFGLALCCSALNYLWNLFYFSVCLIYYINLMRLSFSLSCVANEIANFKHVASILTYKMPVSIVICFFFLCKVEIEWHTFFQFQTWLNG